MSENSGVPTEIPPSQAERIAPIVEQLRIGFNALTQDLPFDLDSALIFDPAPEQPE